ncbi:hypothetical protein WDV76_06340 [Xenorhabdus griffiniae]|uniref:hypothetical protein n=1 Tax=Xenorhabdus griffiniae TaxID=351672 RepID=UPI0030D070E4
MKNLTSLERSKLQLTMMARLYDVFGDVKNEVEVTPEFIQDTLVQFMQMATGNDYHVAKSARIGFGEVKQVQPYQLADEVKRAINATELKSSGRPLLYCSKREDSFDWLKPLTVTEKSDLMQDIIRVIKNHFDKYKDRAVPLHDLQAVFEAITALARKEITGIINADTGKNKLSDDNRLNNILSREMALCLDDVLYRYAVWEKAASENEVLKISRTIHHAFSEYRKDNNYIIYGLPVLKRMISFGVNWADDEESLKLLLRNNCLTIKKALNVLFEGFIKQR